MFYLAKRRYLGKSFIVDQIKVRRFDPIIELHVNNDMLFDILRETDNLVAAAVKMLQETKNSLPALAEAVHNKRYDNAKVLYGVSFINRGIGRLGFQTIPIRNRVSRWMTTWYLSHVFRMVNPHADDLMGGHRGAFVPKLVIMTKDHLFANYGKELAAKAVADKATCNVGHLSMPKGSL